MQASVSDKTRKPLANELAFDSFDPPSKSEKKSSQTQVRKAGEAEFPVFDSYEDLHRVPQEETKHYQIKVEEKPKREVDALEYLVHGANGLSVVTSALAAIGDSIFQKQGIRDGIQKASAFGAKLSMGVNSVFNIINGNKQKDIATVVGYSGELAAALLAPYNVLGLLRGVTFSTYQIPNILTSLGPVEESKTYGENFNMLKERIPIALKKLFQKETYKDVNKNLGLLTGAWGGLLSGAGVLGWLGTGSMKMGGLVKGIGEILVDSFQVLPKEHRECKRTFYMASGLSFIMGSLAEIISKQRNNDPVTMALYFCGSGIGRLLFTLSNILGERNYGPGGIKGSGSPSTTMAAH